VSYRFQQVYKPGERPQGVAIAEDGTADDEPDSSWAPTDASPVDAGGSAA